MKCFLEIYVVFFAGLLPVTNLSSQTLSRYTTTALLKRASSNDTGFINRYPELELNYLMPLIDSAVAVELVKLSGLQTGNGYAYAISLQCRNDFFKQMVLNDLLAHDNLCRADMIPKTRYDQQGLASVYEYGRMSNAMLAQIERGDSDFSKIAHKEFEFWAPMARNYIDTIMKSGLHQLAIKSGKRKFTPCMLASPGNCGLWIACIYLLTGKEEYGSSSEQLNDVYKKLMKKLRIDKKTDNRKGFIRFGKENTVTSAIPASTLDSFDFETIPVLKEKFDNIRKKDNWKIIIYTHGNKGLLFLYYSEKMMIGFTKQWIGSPLIYLVELDSSSKIRLTDLKYRERYIK